MADFIEPTNYEDRLSENGRKILCGRYLRTINGVKETGNELVMRVASAIAGAHPDPDNATRNEFYKMIHQLDFIPNTPCLINAGMPYNQLSACYVLPISDDLGQEDDSIFQTLGDAVVIQQTGGGVGYNFGKLRAKGSKVKKSNGVASGPLSFIRVYDHSCGTVSQGGCLVRDTLVSTARGLLRLDEIVDPERAGWQPHQLVVPTDDGVRNSPRGFNNGIVPVLRVTTCEGMEIAGTPNHRVKVVTTDGIVWRQLDQLHVGDQLLCVAGTHQGEMQQMQARPGAMCRWVDESFAMILGLFVFGGSVWNEYNKDPKLSITLYKSIPTADVVSLLKHNFPGQHIEVCPHLDGYVSYHVNDAQIASFFVENAVNRDSIPAIIRKSPTNVCRAFIRGVLAHGGTSVAEPIGWMIDGPHRLIQEFSALLFELGILNRRETSEVFSAVIIPDHQFINDVLKSDHNRFYNGSKLWHTAQTFPAAPACFGNIQWFAQVKEIKSEAQHALTLDLEVDDNHTYIANGLVTHNTRRGANMAVMPISHPDILEFIQAKADNETDFTNFNFSVAVSDYFMNVLVGNNPDNRDEKNKYDWDLIDPSTHGVSQTVDSRMLFDKIVFNAWKNGEPGILFPDTANEDNMLAPLRMLEATNPCGEIWLTPYESCCLGHINLSRFVTINKTIDIERLMKIVEYGVTFLDNLTDVNGYVSSIPMLQKTAMNSRRIGLGITGFHDMLLKLGVPYSQSEDIIRELMVAINYAAYNQSITLAQKYGRFLWYHQSKWNIEQIDANVNIPTSTLESTNTCVNRVLAQCIADDQDPTIARKVYFQNYPKLEWKNLLKRLNTYGLRNSHLIAIAPTGTTSTLIGTEGYGCEPIFSPSYTRTVQNGDKLVYVSKLYEEVLKEHYLPYERIPAIKKIIDDHLIKTGRLIDNESLLDMYFSDEKNKKAETVHFVIPSEVYEILSCSSTELLPAHHLKIQAQFQKYVDNSISKTINLQESATCDDVRDVYMAAWSKKIKGVTIYRTNSRSFVPLQQSVSVKPQETQPKIGALDVAFSNITSALIYHIPDTDYVVHITNKRHEIKDTDDKQQQTFKKPRPAVLHGTTIEIPTGFGKLFVVINVDEHGNPFEVFVNMGKSGEDIHAVTEAIGRLISLHLRSSVSPNTRQCLCEIVKQLNDIGGRFLTRDKETHMQIMSIPQAVGVALQMWLDKSTRVPIPESIHAPTQAAAETKKQSSSSVSRDLCPECHQFGLERVEKCIKCIVCGFSKC